MKAKEQHPVCSNKIICAPIYPLIFKSGDQASKSGWKSRYTLLMMSIMYCVKLNFDLTEFQSLNINLQHYQTYRCTDKFIGTNCTSLLLNGLALTEHWSRWSRVQIAVKKMGERYVACLMYLVYLTKHVKPTHVCYLLPCVIK